jgi:hypothetical protein
MENTKCQFCDKTFSTKYTLSNHLKTSKSCLKIQEKSNENYKCNYCQKILSTQLRLNTHLNICKSKLIKEKEEKNEKKDEISKYKSIITKNQREHKKVLIQKDNEYKDLLDKKEKEYKDLLIKREQEINIISQQNKDLKEQLEKANNTIAEIAKQPKTISNNDNRIKTQNNIQQTFDINDVKRISNILENHLTPNVLAGGQKGLAEMLKKHLLQNEKGEPIYECTDVSRQKFEFINKYGYVESDPKAAKLITSLNNANIFDVAHSTGKKLWETEEGVNHDAQHVHMPKVTEVLDIKDDSTKFRSHLASITAK